MMDVHVLTHSRTRPQWLRQCLDSLAGQPCTVHVVPGVEGNIAAGRERGFALGVHPYLSFVDSDDWVPEGAVQAMLQAMEQGAAAAVGCERLWLPPGRPGREIRGHHLYVIRRDVLAPHLPGWGQRMRRQQCIAALASIAPPLLVKRHTYWWRMHDEQTSKRGLAL